MRKRALMFGLLWLVLGIVGAQGNVRVVVVNEFQNIRTIPAIGAPVIDTVSAGFEFTRVTGRSADNAWLRVDYQGSEGWVSTVPLIVLEGQIEALPVADPRTIPYGGFEAPRAGPSSATSNVTGRTTAGLRLRAGPGTAYPTLASIPNNEGVVLTGRTFSGNWYQINYEGILGWSAANFVQIIGLPGIEALPIDGVIADAPPSSGDVGDDFEAVIRDMLERVIIAQDALARIRVEWTDAALTGRAQCSDPYPPRPTEITIPLPLLSAFNNQLPDLRDDFNDAMFNVRLAIDLFIQVCNQPGTGNPVGQATIEGALNAVNLAEAQFASLRPRLEALIPEFNLGADQCLLTFNNQREVLPVLQTGVIYLDEFTPRKRVIGFCLDVVQGQNLSFQGLPLPGSDIEFFFSISPLADPTNFILSSRGTLNERAVIGPVIFETSTRIVVIISDLREGGTPPSGEFAFYVANVIAGTTTQVITFDDATASVILTTQTGGAVPPPEGGGGIPTDTICPDLSFTCNQFFTCDEAQACFNAGNFTLDADDDGVPCEATVCPAN